MIHAHGANAMALASCRNHKLLPMSEHSFMFYERVKYVSCNFFFDQDYISEITSALADFPNTFALQVFFSFRTICALLITRATRFWIAANIALMSSLQQCSIPHIIPVSCSISWYNNSRCVVPN